MKNITKFIFLLSFLGGVTLNAQTAVDAHGHLSVLGSQMVGEHGDQVQLKGMSLFWSQWEGEFYTENVVDQLQNDWCTNVVRCAMAVDQGGYLSDPNGEKAKVKAVVDACIAKGMYVIIDWHDHDAPSNKTDAIAFFTEMAQLYGSYPNVLYEIYNEPLLVSWSDNVKPYCEDVIAAIRAEDPDNIIICGTPQWSQDVDAAANDPITGETNIMYTLHYYAGTHKADLRAKATTAINAGLPLFITEFGTVNADGGGAVDQASSNEWFDYIEQHGLSYCNWSLCDKDEGSAVLTPGTGPNDVFSNNLTTAGTFMYNHFTSNCPVYEDNSSTISISFTSPLTSDFSYGENITLTVDASDADGSITMVEFFDGNTSLGVVSSSPYTLDVSSLSVGNHSIKAVATSNTGNTKQTLLTVKINVALLGVATPIIIDGLIDDVWTNVEPLELNNVTVGAVSSEADLSATYKAVWDNDNLYVLIEVTDDSKRSNSGSIYNDDGIEVFIDINNDKNTSFGANDFQYMMRYDDATITEDKNNATTNVSTSMTETNDGYIMELSFPWSTLNENNPQAGDYLGFDVQVNDDDAGSEDRDAKIAWAAIADDTWNNPSLMGTVVLSDLIVAESCKKPVTATILNGALEYCAGDELELIANADNGKLYQWFKDGATIGDALPSGNTLTVDEAGTYKVRIAEGDLNDTECYIESGEVLVIENISPVAVVNEITTAQYCNEVEQGIEVSAQQVSGASYAWISGGTVATNGAEVLLSEGIYQLEVTKNGCSTTSGTFEIIEDCETVLGNVSVTINASSTTINEGDAVTITANASSTVGEIVSLELSDANVTYVTIANNSFTHVLSDLTEGTYTMTATATNASGVVNTAEIIVQVLNETIIYKTSIIPVIDGNLDDVWSRVTPHELTNITSGAEKVTGPGDLEATFRIIWDDNYLYFFGEIIDESLQNDSDERYKDDSPELFFDYGNDKLGAYGEDDVQYVFAWESIGIQTSEGGSTVGIDFEIVTSENGYNLEARFPWSTLGGEANIGDLLGFDFHVNDDDDGGERDSKIAWHATTGGSWQNSAQFGTVLLGGNLDLCSNLELPVIEGAVKACIYNPTETYTYNVVATEGLSYTWTTEGAVLLSQENEEVVLVEFSTGTEATIKVTQTDQYECESEASIDVEFDCPNGTADANNNAHAAYPNPFNQVLHTSGYDSYQLFDLRGVMIQQGEIENNSIETQDLESAVYILKLTNQESTEVIKVTKEL